MYMLVISYESDAERKRIDYAIERWSKEVKVGKPKGVTVLFEGGEEEFRDFFEDIFSRIGNPENKVEVYAIEKYEPEIEKKVKEIKYESKDSLKAVERFISYLMAKLNASYQYSTEFFKVFTAHTKKGQVKISVRIERDGKTEISILVEGYGSVVEFLASKIDYEVRTFLRGG